MFERVMASTQVCKVVRRGLSSLFPGNGMVYVAPSGISVARRELAVTVTHRQVSAEARGRSVGVGGDDHSADRVGEYSN